MAINEEILYLTFILLFVIWVFKEKPKTLLIELTQVGSLRIGELDVFFITTNEFLCPEQRKSINDALKNTLPTQNKILILDGELKLNVLSYPEQKEVGL